MAGRVEGRYHTRHPSRGLLWGWLGSPSGVSEHAAIDGMATATKTKYRKLSEFDYSGEWARDDAPPLPAKCICCGLPVSEEEGWPIFDPSDEPFRAGRTRYDRKGGMWVSEAPLRCMTLKAVRSVRASDMGWFRDNPGIRVRPREITTGEQLVYFITRGWLVEQQEVRLKINKPRFGPETWEVRRRPMFPVE